MLRFLKRVWRGWKSFAHGLIKGQSWLLMAFAYILALAPIALLFKVARPDPLDEKPADPGASTYGGPVRARLQDIRSALDTQSAQQSGATTQE